MAATASIIIEVNDAGATQAFERINAEGVALGNNLKPIGPLSDQAFGSIQSGATRARESAALVSEELGIHIPRAMRGVIAGMPEIASAMNAAFTGLAIVGFIEIAKSAGEAISGLVERFTGWAETAKKTMDAQTALNKTFIDGNSKIDALNKAYQLIGLQGVALYSEKQKLANEDLDEAKKKVSDLTASLAALQKQSTETANVVVSTNRVGVNRATLPTEAAASAQSKIPDVTNALAAAQEKVRELTPEVRNLGAELGDAFAKEKADAIHEIGVQAEEALKKLQAMTSTALKPASGTEAAIAADLQAKQEEIANLLTFSGEEETVRRAAAAAEVAIEKKASDDRLKLLTDEADKKLKAISDGYEAEDKLTQEQALKMRKAETETEKEETDAAIALAPPWERANAKIVDDYQERMSKIKEMLATGEIDEEQAARRMAAAWQEEFAKKRDEIANQLETLFDDITSGNIGKAFLDRFKHLVFEMLATWIAGMNQMHSATQQTMSTGGGGLLGAIFGALGLGGIVGGAGGGVPTASLDDLNALGVTSGSGESGSDNPFGLIPGMTISAGAGSGSAGTVLPVGAFGSNGGGLMGLLQSGQVQQLLAVGGAGLLVNGAQRGGILGVLEDVTGGAISGFGIGAMIGAGLGPLGMGIGALIGGLVGIFSSLFGEHTGDKARIQVMEPLDAQIKVIRDSYDVFQTDYNTGVSELETLRTTSIAALQKIGGKQVSGNTRWVNTDVDAAELYLKTTEAERNRRAQIDFGPAQFSHGGFVHPSLAGGAPAGFAGSAMHFSTGGAVPAILHPNEYVLQASATQRIGPRNLDRVNAGGSLGGDTHNHFTINAIDAKSFEQFLEDGGARKIAASFGRARNRGGF